MDTYDRMIQEFSAYNQDVIRALINICSNIICYGSFLIEWHINKTQSMIQTSSSLYKIQKSFPEETECVLRNTFGSKYHKFDGSLHMLKVMGLAWWDNHELKSFKPDSRINYEVAIKKGESKYDLQGYKEFDWKE